MQTLAATITVAPVRPRRGWTVLSVLLVGSVSLLDRLLERLGR